MMGPTQLIAATFSTLTKPMADLKFPPGILVIPARASQAV